MSKSNRELKFYNVSKDLIKKYYSNVKKSERNTTEVCLKKAGKSIKKSDKTKIVIPNSDLSDIILKALTTSS